MMMCEIDSIISSTELGSRWQVSVFRRALDPVTEIIPKPATEHHCVDSHFLDYTANRSVVRANSDFLGLSFFIHFISNLI